MIMSTKQICNICKANLRRAVIRTSTYYDNEKCILVPISFTAKSPVMRVIRSTGGTTSCYLHPSITIIQNQINSPEPEPPSTHKNINVYCHKNNSHVTVLFIS